MKGHGVNKINRFNILMKEKRRLTKMMIKKRFGILFILLSLFFLAPINLNTLNVSGAPSNLWDFTANQKIECIAISADGNYIVAGTNDSYIYLFGKSSSTPLWQFQAGNIISSVAISG